MWYKSFALTALMSVFFAVGLAFAQLTTGTIVGIVTDSTAAVLPGADVVVLHDQTGISRTVQTDQAGRYSAPSLSVGNYRITASRAGFQTEVRVGVVLTVGRQAIVNFQLSVGAVAQAIEVV